MAASQIACTSFSFSLLFGCLPGEKEFRLTRSIVRTLKGIGLLDASPVYQPVPGFERYALRNTHNIYNIYNTVTNIVPGPKGIFVAALTPLVDAISHGRLQRGMVSPQFLVG